MGDSSYWIPPYNGQFFKIPIEKFSQKRLYLADSAKIAVVRIIFHVLFLVLETRKRR